MENQAIPLVFDLAQPVTELELSLSGKAIAAWKAPSQNEVVYVRFNSRHSAQIQFNRGDKIGCEFHKLYITIPAGQAGDFTFLYGPNVDFIMRIEPGISEVSDVLDQILNELQGDTAEEGYGQTNVGVAAVQIIAANADRKACSIQAKSTNTGIVYIGFDNLVTTINFFAELQPGMSVGIDDYRGDLYALADAAGQLVGWGEW